MIEYEELRNYIDHYLMKHFKYHKFNKSIIKIQDIMAKNKTANTDSNPSSPSGFFFLMSVTLSDAYHLWRVLYFLISTKAHLTSVGNN